MSLETAMDDVKKIAKSFVQWIDGHFGLAQYLDDGKEKDAVTPTKPSTSTSTNLNPIAAAEADKGVQTP